jgi:polysaccharide export outer membrane protein
VSEKIFKKISLKTFISISALIFSLTTFLSSCTTYKQLQYLQGDIDSSKYSKFNVPEQKVQKGDQISVAVFSDNAAASAMFNTGSIPSTVADMSQASLPGSGVSSAGNVYEVDNEGMIFFPQIGKLYVEGQTKEGLTKLLNNQLKDKFLTNPYYVIRFINLKITVFGDVNSPGVYPLTRANTNIFEALTLAGDMTFFGKRDNILVIREKDGKRVFARIDVTKPDVFNSPYYYLQQNDIVFVDMRKGKVNSADQSWMRNVSLGMGLLSALTILVNLISR